MVSGMTGLFNQQAQINNNLVNLTQQPSMNNEAYNLINGLPVMSKSNSNQAQKQFNNSTNPYQTNPNSYGNNNGW
jgi:hypothetical protein